FWSGRRRAPFVESSHGGRPVGHNGDVVVAEAVNMRELRRYVERVSDRWPLAHALLGGARVDDARGAGEQRERGAEYVMVLVSEGFDGMPWLERVYPASGLLDGGEVGGPAPSHLHT